MHNFFKKVKNGTVDWVFIFILAALSMFFFLLISNISPFGKYTVLSGDSLEQYVSNIRMVTRTIKNGGNIHYSFSTSMGQNISAFWTAYIISPFNVLYILFPSVDVNTISFLLIILKTGFSATCFWLFSSKILKGSRAANIIFSVFYSMCAFSVVYGFINITWLDGMYMLPIVAIALNYSIKKKNYLWFSLTLIYILLVHFYTGYIIIIFSILYFASEVFIRKKQDEGFICREHIFKYLISVVIAILVTAFVWLPFFYFVMKQNASDKAAFGYIWVYIYDLINNLFWGQVQDYNTIPYVYCGIPAILLLPNYFLNKRISKDERVVYGIMLSFFVLGCIFIPFYELLSGFSVPSNWNYRFSFIISFLLCLIAVRESQFICDISNKGIALELLSLVFLYLIVQRVQEGKFGVLSANSNENFVINLLLILLWVLIGLWSRHQKKIIFYLIMILFCFTEVVSNSYVCLNKLHYQETCTIERKEYEKWKEEMDSILFSIDDTERNNHDFYRVVVFSDLIKNGDTFWGYNGISDYSVAENIKLRNFNRDMGMFTTTGMSLSTGLSTPIEMLYSIRYKSTLFPEEIDGEEQKNLSITKNPYALSGGYVCHKDNMEMLQFDDNVFDNQNKVFGTMTGIGDIWKRVSDEDIIYENDGLLYLKEDGRIVKDRPGDANMKIRVKDSSNPVYVLISPKDSEELLGGIWYDLPPNLANLEYEQIIVSVPHLAEMKCENEEYTLSIGANDSFYGQLDVNDVYIYELDMDKLREVYDLLNKESLTEIECKEGYLKGKVTVDANDQLLMTSIPYIDGWHVFLNSEEVKPIAVLNGSFLAVELPGQGEYDVIFKYECPGLNWGIIVSIIGSLAILVQGVLLFVRRNKINGL